jgi:hypothetical protein
MAEIKLPPVTSACGWFTQATPPTSKATTHLRRDHHKVQTTDAMGSHHHEEHSGAVGLHFEAMVMEN